MTGKSKPIQKFIYDSYMFVTENKRWINRNKFFVTAKYVDKDKYDEFQLMYKKHKPSTKIISIKKAIARLGFRRKEQKGDSNTIIYFHDPEFFKWDCPWKFTREQAPDLKFVCPRPRKNEYLKIRKKKTTSDKSNECSCKDVPTTQKNGVVQIKFPELKINKGQTNGFTPVNFHSYQFPQQNSFQNQQQQQNSFSDQTFQQPQQQPQQQNFYFDTPQQQPQQQQPPQQKQKTNTMYDLLMENPTENIFVNNYFSNSDWNPVLNPFDQIDSTSFEDIDFLQTHDQVQNYEENPFEAQSNNNVNNNLSFFEDREYDDQEIQNLINALSNSNDNMPTYQPPIKINNSFENPSLISQFY